MLMADLSAVKRTPRVDPEPCQPGDDVLGGDHHEHGRPAFGSDLTVELVRLENLADQQTGEEAADSADGVDAGKDSRRAAAGDVADRAPFGRLLGIAKELDRQKNQ